MSELNDKEAFCTACLTGDFDTIKELVESGRVDVNEKCPYPDGTPGHIPLIQVLDGITSNLDLERDSIYYEIIAFLIYSGADVNKVLGNEYVQYTIFDIWQFKYLEPSQRHKHLINFLNDMRSGDEQILRFFKMLYEKHIFLSLETIFEIIHTMKNEYPAVKSRGGKRKTRRQKQRHRRTKSKH